MKRLGLSRADMLLLDLGVSSMQLDRPERGDFTAFAFRFWLFFRTIHFSISWIYFSSLSWNVNCFSFSGFSFSHEGPLDMRMDASEGVNNVIDLLLSQSDKKLADLIFEYSDERLSKRIARNPFANELSIENTYLGRFLTALPTTLVPAGGILRAFSLGQLQTTKDLEKICMKAYPEKYKHKTSPATRTFQALRIAVNGNYCISPSYFHVSTFPRSIIVIIPFPSSSSIPHGPFQCEAYIFPKMAGFAYRWNQWIEESSWCVCVDPAAQCSYCGYQLPFNGGIVKNNVGR